MNNRDNRDMTAPVRVVTRGSALARWQTEAVATGLRAVWPGLEVEIVEVQTRGDLDLSDRLVGRLDKGFFTSELELMIREGRADLAVHSLKDLPTSAVGLCIGAILPRGPVADVLIIREEGYDPGAPGLPLLRGARVGSSAPRREALLGRYAPQARALPLRGNVPTRVRRLREGAYEAIVLAEAGITRLGLDMSGLVVLRLDPTRFVPAPGQGAIAAQIRAEDAETLRLLAPLDHAATAADVALERRLLAASEAGCQSPFGAMARGEHVVWGMGSAHGWIRRRAPRSAVEGEIPALLEDDATVWEDDDEAALYEHL